MWLIHNMFRFTRYTSEYVTSDDNVIHLRFFMCYIGLCGLSLTYSKTCHIHIRSQIVVNDDTVGYLRML